MLVTFIKLVKLLDIVRCDTYVALRRSHVVLIANSQHNTTQLYFIHIDHIQWAFTYLQKHIVSLTTY